MSWLGVQMKVATFAARDVVGVGAVEVTVGQFLLIEFDEDAVFYAAVEEGLFFFGGAVAPEDVVWLAEFDGLFDPFLEVSVDGRARADWGFGGLFGFLLGFVFANWFSVDGRAVISIIVVRWIGERQMGKCEDN